jgi:hypothetical protein
MPTQRLDDAHLSAVSTSLLPPRRQTSLVEPFLQLSRYPAPYFLAEVIRPRAASAETEWPAEAFVDVGDLGRGVSWALAIEGAVALSICGLWYLCHLWR